jgi:hypothetical protein
MGTERAPTGTAGTSTFHIPDSRLRDTGMPEAGMPETDTLDTGPDSRRSNTDRSTHSRTDRRSGSRPTIQSRGSHAGGMNSTADRTGRARHPPRANHICAATSVRLPRHREDRLRTPACQTNSLEANHTHTNGTSRTHTVGLSYTHRIVVRPYLRAVSYSRAARRMIAVLKSVSPRAPPRPRYPPPDCVRRYPPRDFVRRRRDVVQAPVTRRPAAYPQRVRRTSLKESCSSPQVDRTR